MPSARVMVDAPARGAWNMAVDEALLDLAAHRGGPTLRLYQWQEPTLSLGYFQEAAQRDEHAASRECPLVRRSSGGGAIIHDRELTYSFVVPIRDSRSSAAKRLYDLCHATLCQALSEFSVAAEQFSPGPGNCARHSGQLRQEPFLCFARRTCGDIICAEAKIVGSAQRRRHGAVLQHGSILLARSDCAPELPGIAELADQRLDPVSFGEVWSGRLLNEMGLTPVADVLSPAEIAAATEHYHQRFVAPSFLQRR